MKWRNIPGQLYEPAYVQRLFDEMAVTYRLVNMVSSFGFCRRWRKQCVRQIEIPEAGTVVDLMSGAAELCRFVVRSIGPQGTIVAVDISPVMCGKALQRQKGRICCSFDVLEADALCSNMPPNSADVVISSFGLKTYSDLQLGQLANEVKRILKPNGEFSLIEISVPPFRWLRVPYLFYLNHLIPIIGRLLMGNPENYRLLGVYTVAFGSCNSALAAFRQAGLETEVRSFFFGCATALVGRNPTTSRQTTRF